MEPCDAGRFHELRVPALHFFRTHCSILCPSSHSCPKGSQIILEWISPADAEGATRPVAYGGTYA